VATLGIDLGTGSVKCALVSEDGLVLAQASRSYQVSSVKSGWAESDPAQWIRATREVVERVLIESNVTPTSVGFSGQMHGVVIADSELKPLRPAILWADSRASDEANQMSMDLGINLLSRLGSPAVPGFSATTLAWLKLNEPGLFVDAKHVLQPKDWLRAALGGQIASDPSDASGTLLFDSSAGDWSKKAVQWSGVEPELLPPVRASQASAGYVDFNGTKYPCVVGGADTACVLSSLGLEPGQGFIAVGSGSQVVRVLEGPDFDSTLRTHTFATVGQPRSGWYRIGAIQNAGLSLTAALRWFNASIEEGVAALSEGLRDEDPLYIPYLSGERTPFMNSHLRGSWHDLTLSTDRPAMLRSIFVGVAQAVALGVSAVEETGASLPKPTPLVGGGTHNPVFRQLLADATGVPLAVMEAPDAAVIGAALLGAGLTSNPIPQSWSEVVTPDPLAAESLLHLRQSMLKIMKEEEYL